MSSHTPQDHQAFESPNSDELAVHTTRPPRQHNWSATQAMLAAFLVLVVVIAFSLLR